MAVIAVAQIAFLRFGVVARHNFSKHGAPLSASTLLVTLERIRFTLERSVFGCIAHVITILKIQAWCAFRRLTHVASDALAKRDATYRSRAIDRLEFAIGATTQRGFSVQAALLFAFTCAAYARLTIEAEGGKQEARDNAGNYFTSTRVVKR